MASEQRNLAGPDSFDSPSFRHGFHIPPLQNPLPLIPSRRPPPLEPTATVIDNSSRSATAKLGTRAKALEDALPIGDEHAASSFWPVEKSASLAPLKEVDRGVQDPSRKKQKVDFFQLPKPTAKPRANKPPPFKPVPPVLNELHEPPPSAGLFPPITPNALHDTDKPSITIFPVHPRREASKGSPAGRGSAPEDVPASLLEAAALEKESKTKPKRVCLRGRLKWTDKETDDLLSGVAIYGVGRWKKILVHPGLVFHPDRTMVDLKDRYRTCRMNEEKAIEKQAAIGNHKREKKKAPAKASSNNGRDPAGQERSKASRPSSPANRDQLSPASPEAQCSFEITTPAKFNKEQNPLNAKNKRPYAFRPWSEEEDASLSQGYYKYGFSWSKIASDPQLSLIRTGAQVRDRFRMKYPIVYQSSVPLPLPDAPERAPRAKAIVPKEDPPKSSKSTAELSIILHQPAPLVSDKYGRMTYGEPNKDPYLPPSHIKSAALPARRERDKFAGLMDVQPLPDSEPEDDAPGGSSPPASPSSESNDIDEARHLGNPRLRPFKYTFDDDWANGNEDLTLPPLWEELATKPMFDLE